MSFKALGQIISVTRGSVLEQLQTANALFDVVRELISIAQELPNEQKEAIEAEALKIYQKASKLSDEAARVGRDLAKFVGE